MSSNSSRSRSREWFSRQFHKVKHFKSSKPPEVPTAQAYPTSCPGGDSSATIVQAQRASSVHRSHTLLDHEAELPHEGSPSNENDKPTAPEIRTSAGDRYPNSSRAGPAEDDPDVQTANLIVDPDVRAENPIVVVSFNFDQEESYPVATNDNLTISDASPPHENSALVDSTEEDPGVLARDPIILVVAPPQEGSSLTTKKSKLNSNPLDGNSSDAIHSPTCWEIAFEELTAAQRQVLEAFRIQNSATLQAEITTLQSMKDGCKSLTPGTTDKRPIITRVRIHNILKKMEKYAVIGNIALQHNPNIVALVWAGVRFCLQVALNDMHTFEGVSAALDDIAGVLGSCTFYERIYDSELESAKAVFEQLPRLYAHCLRFMAKAIDYFQTTTAKRVAKGVTNPFETSFKPLIEEMNDAKVELERRCDAASRELQDTMSHSQIEEFGKLGKQISQFRHQMVQVGAGIDEINANVNDEQRRLVLNWLSTVDFPAHHENARGVRFDGSGGWLFEKPEFQDWIEQECSSVLWLSGKAGSGKTILSSLVIDTLSETYKSVPTIYFYCHYAELNRQQTSFIIGSLLKQLLISPWCGSLDPQMLALFKDGSVLNPKTAELLLARFLARFRKVHMVVDALDECSEKERKSIVMLLIRRLNLNVDCHVKILFTSRPEHDLQQLLRVGSWHEIDANDTLKDITPFVKTELDELIESHSLLDGNVSVELRQDLIDDITRQADGMFLWARFQLDYICKQGNETQVRDQLMKLPRGLQTTYDRIWERITNAETTERDWALKTLSWILVAKVPLRPNVVLEATAREPFLPLDRGQMASSIGYLVRVCGNFIALDRETGCLRFTHYSVQEFLRDKQEFYSAAECAAEICLTVLSDERLLVRYLPWDMPEPGSTLCLYAVHHWHEYCRSWEAIDERRGRLLLRFFQGESTFDCWKMSHLALRKPFDTVYAAAAYLTLPVILRYLQQLGSQDDGFAQSQSAALIVAARCGGIEVVKTLLDFGADANYQHVTSAPRAAAKTAGSEVTMMLMPSSEVEPAASGQSALLEAINRDAPDIVELLLSAGADPNQNAPGMLILSIPLYDAAKKGFKKVVELLLEAGARPDPKGVIFTTSLQHGHYHLIGLLLSAGANPNEVGRVEGISRVDGVNGIPLALAARNGEAVQLLLNAGARPDEEGYALREAVNGNGEISVEMLLSAGADPNAVGPYCDNALYLAVMGCDAKINRIRAGAVRTSERILKRLLEAGADPHALIDVWITVLNYAVSWSTPLAVELLLNAGSDVNVVGRHGLPLQAAIDRGDKRIIELLRAKCATELAGAVNLRATI